MRAIYEVWDTETAHQVGTFGTQAEAEGVLRDVLRVNGPAVVREMVILMYPSPGARPVTLLKGATFATRALSRA